LIGNALKLRTAIWLICLLLLVAAIDTIPDPPAINPPTSHSCGVSAVHIQAASTLLEKEWFAAASPPRRFLIDWYLLRSTFENLPSGVCPLLLVHFAADPSPPCFS
jgi:hypothetical protein